MATDGRYIVASHPLVLYCRHNSRALVWLTTPTTAGRAGGQPEQGGNQAKNYGKVIRDWDKRSGPLGLHGSYCASSLSRYSYMLVVCPPI